jgi:hypothetical protein
MENRIMPLRDWTRVDTASFHAFHFWCIAELSRALKDSLPAGYYALPEQRNAPHKQVVIRHVSGHRIAAVIEVVSPGNKSGNDALTNFRDKAILALQQGIHLMVLNLFPPGKNDPFGIHGLLAEACGSPPYVPPLGRDRLMVSYRAGQPSQAFIEPVGVGEALPNLVLFLRHDLYVTVPLERAYGRASELVPDFWFEEGGATDAST